MDRERKAALARQLEEVSRLGRTFLDDGGDTARRQLLETIAKMNVALETPADFVQKLGWAEPARNTALRMTVDLGIFEMLKASDQSLKVEGIAAQTEADPALIARMMKHMAAMHVVEEVGQDAYRGTPLSDALTEPANRDGIKYTLDVAGPSFLGTPAYLAKTGYQNPSNIMDGPFQFGHKTDLPFFAYLNQKPDSLTHFNNYMTGFRQGKARWLDFYPVNESLLQGSRVDDVLMVDVGGGLGHDLHALRQRFPDVKHKLILQDRKEVIQPLTSDDAFEAQSHDFFTEQPVKGARAYFLHSVLHDWDDEHCTKILRNLRAAMEPGYSRLLINEYVVPDTGASWPVTSMDWLMMALGAVKERTEAQWTSLLEKAGLRLKAVCKHDQGTESLIEAEVAV